MQPFYLKYSPSVDYLKLKCPYCYNSNLETGLQVETMCPNCENLYVFDGESLKK